MQQRDRFVFVAGTFIGLWGGALGAFLITTTVPVAMCRLMNHLDERYIELSPPVLPGRQLADDHSRWAVSITSQG